MKLSDKKQGFFYVHLRFRRAVRYVVLFDKKYSLLWVLEVHALVFFFMYYDAEVFKRRKLAWFGRVTRHDSLSKTILRGTLESGNAVVGRGKCCMGNMPELVRRASCRKDWKRISTQSSHMSRPTTQIGQGTQLN